MSTTRFGLTWWGQRWIAALEALGAVYANRLPRGRTYARRGAVQDLAIGPGEVTARVQGTRATPYRVRLQLPVFDEATWQAITEALGARLRHAAELLDGRMPDDIDDVLIECGVSLFPTARELTTSCSCPDSANPCKHVAAVHYVLAQAFDADPFLLPTLRGRDRDRLLGALRAHRAGTGQPAPSVDAPSGPLALDELVARDLFTTPADRHGIAIRPRPPTDPAALVRALGAPPGLAPAATAIEAAVEDAARVAWELLDGDGDPVPAALRRLGPTSARALSERLGMNIQDVHARLRELRGQGRVSVTGRGPGTRYHLQH